MSRTKRSSPGGVVQHVLNRGNDRKQLFVTDADYAAFTAIVMESLLLCPLRVLEYCVMPNHWHFVVWPRQDNDLPKLMHRMTTTHATRWNAFRGRTGWGHVYQGPYKNFPVQADGHLLAVCRYVVRNARRANLVERAEDWPWCSLNSAQHIPLTDWPIEKPHNWVDRVNQPLTAAEQQAIERSIHKGTPFGSPEWTQATAQKLGIEHTLRDQGRPHGSRNHRLT